VTIWVATTLQQWALFIAVVLAVGCVAWLLVVRPSAARAVSEESTVRGVERKVASLGVGIAVTLVLVWLVRGAVQLWTFRDPFVPIGEDISFLLFDLFWGKVWMGQGVVVLLLAAAFLAVRPPVGDSVGSLPGRVTAARWLAAALSLALVASLAMSSHAMGVESATALAVTADGVHLLAAGTWIGSLAVIVSAGRSGGPRYYAAQLRCFSPMAVASVTALILMGVGLSWVHLVQVSDLWTETYGRVLGAKVLLAGVVLLLGFMNWRKGLPAIDSEGGAATVQRQAVIEVSVAIGVLLLTAVLVHSPKP
jgi:putative copper export protein